MLQIGVDCGVVFLHNGLDFNDPIVFVLAYRDVFLHGGILYDLHDPG